MQAEASTPGATSEGIWESPRPPNGRPATSVPATAQMRAGTGKPRRFQECHMNCSWGSVPGFVLSRLWPGPWVVILPSKPCPGGNLQTASQLCSRQSAAVVPPGQQIRFPSECTFIHGVLCVSRGSQWAEWQRTSSYKNVRAMS